MGTLFLDDITRKSRQNWGMGGRSRVGPLSQDCGMVINTYIIWRFCTKPPIPANTSSYTIFLYIMWPTIVVFISTYLWPNVSPMCLYEETDFATLTFINTSCRMSTLKELCHNNYRAACYYYFLTVNYDWHHVHTSTSIIDDDRDHVPYAVPTAMIDRGNVPYDGSETKAKHHRERGKSTLLHPPVRSQSF